MKKDGSQWNWAKQTTWYYLRLAQTHLDKLRLRYYGPDREIVIFFGDSRAKAWPPPPGFSQFEFINRGISFDTSTQLRQRFARHIKPLSPNYVVVQIGINDFKPFCCLSDNRETIVTTCKRNIEQLVTWSLDIGATVILTTIFPVRHENPVDGRSLQSFAMVQVIKEINAYIHSLERPNVVAFDAYSLLVGDQGFIQSRYAQDALHINSLAYDVLNKEFSHILTAGNKPDRFCSYTRGV